MVSIVLECVLENTVITGR